MTTARIVEDNQSFCELLRILLSMHECDSLITQEPFSAALGPEMWDGVDIAFVDLLLPDTNGVLILRYLKEDHPQIRRVLLSGVEGTSPLWALARGLAHETISKDFGGLINWDLLLRGQR